VATNPFLLSSFDLRHISEYEQDWLRKTIERFGGYPTLEQLWAVMDEIWIQLSCDPKIIDDRIAKYYSHPVWLLNGLFIEQDKQSIEYRNIFTNWVCSQHPKRVADYGGGFGVLARMIGEALPHAVIEVIEPHPSRLAVERSLRTKNVSYKEELSGEYDIIIATDVFEHVEDPLKVVADTSAYMSENGRYLIANCFHPVIHCHLPDTFHFRFSWNATLRAMGLVKFCDLAYGSVFIRSGKLKLDEARVLERKSQKLWPFVGRIPAFIARPLTRALLSVN